MIINKLRTFLDENKLTNIIKICVLLLSLFIIARLLIPKFNEKTTSYIEGFEALGYKYYGNELTLQNPSNQPQYAGNTCIFKLDGVYRLEGLSLNFNNNNNTSTLPDACKPFDPSIINQIYIQYEDGNGNLRYIKSSISGSPPNFSNNNDLNVATVSRDNGLVQLSSINLSNITDENNMVVYTSKIVVSVGNKLNRIDRYLDDKGNGYISNFGFWGSSRDMLSRSDFESLAPTLSLQSFSYNTSIYDDKTNLDSYTFSTVSDMVLYGICLDYDSNILELGKVSNQSESSGFDTTDNPFRISIIYNNGLYSGNNFTINTKYILRSDLNRIHDQSNTRYIIFPQPIIANKVTINSPRIRTLVTHNIIQCNISNLKGYGNVPTQNDISNYQRNVNALLNASNQEQILDVCPSVDNLIMKQNQAQQICDNLEYQDKVKSEKLRLEKNKQYLLKLKQQQMEIDELNKVISTLDQKRQTRSTANDIARVSQYQQQKEIATTVRDIANQRLQSQANNQLYLDVNIKS